MTAVGWRSALAAAERGSISLVCAPTCAYEAGQTTQETLCAYSESQGMSVFLIAPAMQSAHLQHNSDTQVQGSFAKSLQNTAIILVAPHLLAIPVMQHTNVKMQCYSHCCME